LGDQWNNSDRLFTTWNGLPIFPDTLTGWFRDFTRKHNFPPVTFHSLHHPYGMLTLKWHGLIFHQFVRSRMLIFIVIFFDMLYTWADIIYIGGG